VWVSNHDFDANARVLNPAAIDQRSAREIYYERYQPLKRPTIGRNMESNRLEKKKGK
jgi:hypothetical protein